MGNGQASARQSRLEQQIAEAMEELRQLLQKPTLDDFQNFWRKKLEATLGDLRDELRPLAAANRKSDTNPAV